MSDEAIHSATLRVSPRPSPASLHPVNPDIVNSDPRTPRTSTPQAGAGKELGTLVRGDAAQGCECSPIGRQEVLPTYAEYISHRREAERHV